MATVDDSIVDRGDGKRAIASILDEGGDAAAASAFDETALNQQEQPCIILFYKYHPLSDDPVIVELYRKALETFCASLTLKGRILVGCSKHRSEGINGTLSGTKTNLQMFCRAFTKSGPTATNPLDSTAAAALQRFQTDCETFYEAAECPPLEMNASEFKWSELNATANGDESQNDAEEMFPDLNIKIVSELIGTGGVLSSIPIDQLHEGYLTPQEWHERITKLQQSKTTQTEDEESNDTILIDCRNTKECAIGNFVGSIDPQTTTFNQFPKWVDDHKHKLRNKNVLMYCTGGIRCEKASAYVRQAMGNSVKEVRHLQGGIHKYLEAYGSGENPSAPPNGGADAPPLWRGKNFVFDGRGAHGPASEKAVASTAKPTAGDSASAGDAAPVGACRYCGVPYDSFDPHCVCTVCKEPILICPGCQEYPLRQPQHEEGEGADANHGTGSPNRPQHHREYHCVTHKHMEHCYFTNLEGFSRDDLTQQLSDLEILSKAIAVGKKFKQRRKTLAKQRAKISAKLETMAPKTTVSAADNGRILVPNTAHGDREDFELKCRNCGQIGCSGKCWGFHGLKRKRVLEQKEEEERQCRKAATIVSADTLARSSGNIKNKKKNAQNERLKRQKELQKQKQIEEWISSGLTLGPKIGRDPITGLRVPKPCVRVLETTTKGKWCGRSLLKVLQTEFPNSFRSQQQQQSSSQSTETDTENTLRTLFRRKLIRVNGVPIPSLDEANSYKLKNMDVIDRIVLWHEPPIHLPSETIPVEKIPIPTELLGIANGAMPSTAGVDPHIYVCNKPSTVPVHPAGPYLSNSLTMLVEAQIGLAPKTLIPCHRIDRVTSGMTICCTHPRVARLVQTTIAAKISNQNGNKSSVRKQYLAKVTGRFPSKDTDDFAAFLPNLPESDGLAKWEWIESDHNETMVTDDFEDSNALLQVDAPIETVDPLNGIRKITAKGKTSTSIFRLLEYDTKSDTSILACVPVTGRSHQLRVHLQWLGHSIVNDVQYGGSTTEETLFANTQLDSCAGVERMLDSVREYKSTLIGSSTPSNDPLSIESRESGDALGLSWNITQEQAQGAREVCPTCDLDTEGRGPSSTFSPAQLLQGGHAICLHAYRYSLDFPSNTKGSSKTTSNGSSISISNMDEGEKRDFRIDLQVDPPLWASHLKSGSIN